jgi:hypothetical protein
MVVATGLGLEGLGLAFHARDLRLRGGEGAAAHAIQTGAFGYTYRARNVLLAAGAAGAIAFFLLAPGGAGAAIGWGLLLFLVAAQAVVGRLLFYALVIPTTLPGAFFWRNPAFEAHARETGLAKLPQVGVAPCTH